MRRDILDADTEIAVRQKKKLQFVLVNIGIEVLIFNLINRRLKKERGRDWEREGEMKKLPARQSRRESKIKKEWPGGKRNWTAGNKTVEEKSEASRKRLVHNCLEFAEFLLFYTGHVLWKAHSTRLYGRWNNHELRNENRIYDQNYLAKCLTLGATHPEPRNMFSSPFVH